MRRIVFLLSIFLMCAVAACEDSSMGSGKVIITSGNELNISMNGGRATITYTTKGDVSPDDIDVTITEEWLKIADAKHLGEVVVSAEANETGGTRMAAVSIAVGSQVTTVIVNQSGTPDLSTITPTSATEVELERVGQPVVVTYELNNKNDDGYTYAKYDAEWIYAVNTNVEGEVTLYVATNTSDESRTADVKIGYGGASFDVVITQAGEGDYNFSATSFVGDYYGDFYTPGAGNYFLKFSDRGFTSEGSTMPFGTYYRIDAYGPVFTEEEGVITIPEGEYTYDPELTYTTWTFVADYTDFFVNDKNGEHEKQMIESGKMVVMSNSITLDLIINGENHHVVYNGSIEVADLRGDVNILTTLDEDYTLDLSHHSMIYACQGDWYDFGYMNWVFQIMPDDGDGDCLQIDIITEYSDEESGFAGTYTASEVRATNAFMLGWVYGGYMECSWFYTSSQDEMAPFRDGVVTVKHNDDGTYTVDVDVADDLRNRITGTWTGVGTAQER